MKIYKITDKAIEGKKRWITQNNSFTSVGRVWQNPAHVRLKLAYLAEYLSREKRDKIHRERMIEAGIDLRDGRAVWQASKDIPYPKALSKEEQIDCIPETYVVVEFDGDKVREYSARDFLRG